MLFYHKQFRLMKEEIEEMKTVQEQLLDLCGEIRGAQELLQEDQTRAHSKMEKQIDKNSMSVEDMIVSIGEISDALAAQDNERKLYKEQLREYDTCEKKLLELIMLYQDIFWDLYRYSEKNDENLKRQMELAEKKIMMCNGSIGVSNIGEKEVPADPMKHEIIEFVKTDKPELAGAVSEVFSKGCIYRGKVVKKAKVSVYKCDETEKNIQ